MHTSYKPRQMDATTHHWPGCAMPYHDSGEYGPFCQCHRTDPDTSEFGQAMREGDRAIAAMVTDTSTTEPEPIDTSRVVSMHVYTTHSVQIRPGFTVLRPLHLVRAFSSRPQFTNTNTQGA